MSSTPNPDDPETSDASLASRATVLITAGSGSIAFMLGFNYGAHGVVFFEQIFTVWVVATVVLVASVFTRVEPRTWGRRLILLIPSLWIVISWLANNTDAERIDDLVLAFTLAVTLAALPFVGWILVTTINSDFAELPNRSKAFVLGSVALFLVIGFLLGARNDLILTCDDFKVSGNDLPTNCVSETASGG
ncbi:MAG: hypothetical protein ACR2N7_10910 [Acidimicrobiia bacterium]